MARAWQVLETALALGLTSFGGPIAHLGYFERTYVRQKQWLAEEEYGHLVALCQVLPGPTSSQVGFLIGLRRAGWLGGLAAWLGFTLPSAVLLYACAVVAPRLQDRFAEAAVHALKLVAVAVVAQAVWNMARRLCRDRITATVAVISAAILLLVGGAASQIVVLVLAAVAGILLCRPGIEVDAGSSASVTPAVAWIALGCFVALLALASFAGPAQHDSVGLGAIFYRSGALVFGGGHVVLPLLRDALVPAGWISDDRFLAGYGLAQAVPGPLFAFAAYVGATDVYSSIPILSASVALVAIFLPGLLIATAAVALWHRFAKYARLRAALVGVNAAVVGVLAAALYDPVWTTGVKSMLDASVAVAGMLLLERWKVSPLLVLAMTVGVSEIAALGL